MGNRVSEAQVVRLVMQKLETLSGSDGIVTNLGGENVADTTAPVVELSDDIVFEREGNGGSNDTDQADRVLVTWSLVCSVTPSGVRADGMIAIAQVAESAARLFDNLALTGDSHTVECERPRVVVTYHKDEDLGPMCVAMVECRAVAWRTDSSGAKVVDYIGAA